MAGPLGSDNKLNEAFFQTILLTEPLLYLTIHVICLVHGCLFDFQLLHGLWWWHWHRWLYRYLNEFVKTPEEANAAEFKFLANADLNEISLKNASAEKKSHFFNWFAQGTACYLNPDNYTAPVWNAFVLGKHIPNINSMLKKYVRCAGEYASLYNIFNEYDKHCDGFQTLTKDQFKTKSWI